MTDRDAPAPVATSVVIEAEDVRLSADVTRPRSAAAYGVVVFAHGSGSSRLSPRNRAVAARLVDSGLATVLLDLLTAAEEREDEVTREYRFDIPLLASRLVAATDWLSDQDTLAGLPVGYFGASTGAAAALIAAARRPDRVSAVVSRGGRPDLAERYLDRVRAPTLLIVGGNDPLVLDLNRRAARPMRRVARIEIVPGATHLFQERGALERVSELACEWFLQYLDGKRTGGNDRSGE
ncbi:dienelactone hydrolase family protein [Arhodomonas sp. AD133]|uniref:dienelactone hydrolase family protein n=1 Tax=Arhodomonas sp. AD133 TaxID=3415009 RepID=UPI003EB8B367